jgi:uncharacterized membrane protein
MRAHPWHPVLVHFPIAFWTTAVLLDVAALLRLLPESAGETLPGFEPATFSFALLWLGIAFGLPAMALGFVDFLRLPAALQKRAALNWHAIAMTSAWAFFLCAALLRPRSAAPAPHPSLAAMLVEIAGLGCLVAGGVLASAVVFDGWPRRAEPERGSDGA